MASLAVLAPPKMLMTRMFSFVSIVSLWRGGVPAYPQASPFKSCFLSVVLPIPFLQSLHLTADAVVLFWDNFIIKSHTLMAIGAGFFLRLFFVSPPQDIAAYAMKIIRTCAAKAEQRPVWHWRGKPHADRQRTVDPSDVLFIKPPDIILKTVLAYVRSCSRSTMDGSFKPFSALMK